MSKNICAIAHNAKNYEPSRTNENGGAGVNISRRIEISCVLSDVRAATQHHSRTFAKRLHDISFK